MADSWASQLRSDKRFQCTPEQNAIAIIQNLLQHTSESPATAAAQLAALHEPRIKNGDVSQPSGLWKIITNAIDHLGADHAVQDDLVALLQSLAALPSITDAATGHPIPSNTNAQIYWRDLPGFTLTFRDQLMCVPPADLIDSGRLPTTWPAETRRFTHANLFCALRLRAPATPAAERDACAAYALWHMSGALEVDVRASSVLGRRRMELWVPQAGNWVFVAGAELWRLCGGGAAAAAAAQEGEGEGEAGPAQERCLDDGAVEGFLYKGREGFSGERWAFWKRRFGEIAAMEGVGERVAGVAGRAAGEMARFG